MFVERSYLIPWWLLYNVQNTINRTHTYYLYTHNWDKMQEKMSNLKYSRHSQGEIRFIMYGPLE